MSFPFAFAWLYALHAVRHSHKAGSVLSTLVFIDNALQVQQSELSAIRDANEFALTESGAVLLLLQGQSSTADE
jgi:hypothetical protein